MPFPPPDVDDRIRLARAKIEGALGRMLEVIHLQAAVEIIVYSRELSAQIPQSHAATAYGIFTQTMFKGLLSKTIALWDSPRTDRNSLPTICLLVDDEAVLSALRSAHVDARRSGRLIDIDDDDPELAQWLADMTDRDAVIDADAAADRLRQTITGIKSMREDRIVKAMIHFRDMYLAHHLGDEARKPDLIGRYGEERQIINDTIALLEGLNLGVRWSNFMWDDAKSNAKRAAEELWLNCTFEIPTR